MSLCDACYRPGTCCKEIRFYGGHRNGEHTFWLDENIEQQVSGQDPENLSNHPFEVLKVDEKFTDKKTGREYGTVVFKCKNLTAEGRCGDYENRPLLCKSYEPRSDNLCVHYQGAESGDPSIPFSMQEH